MADLLKKYFDSNRLKRSKNVTLMKVREERSRDKQILIKELLKVNSQNLQAFQLIEYFEYLSSF